MSVFSTVDIGSWNSRNFCYSQICYAIRTQSFCSINCLLQQFFIRQFFFGKCLFSLSLVVGIIIPLIKSGIRFILICFDNSRKNFY